MVDRIFSYSLRQRVFVLLGVIALAVAGVWSALRLPMDAVPDITNVQVQINTEARGYSPLEAEQRITFPLETALSGIPKLDYTRSLSRYGLSQVTVAFKDLGFAGPVHARDLWAHKDLGVVRDSFTATPPKGGVVMLRLWQ